MGDTLLTIQEAATYLKVHWQTVRGYIKSGTLPFSKIGRNVRIKQSDLENFIEGKEQKNEKKEIEIRFRVSNRKELENRIINLDGKVAYHSHIIDHWYVPHYIKSNKENDEFYEGSKGYGVRIREQDNNYSGNIITTLETKCLAGEDKDHSVVVESETSIPSYDEGDKLLKNMHHKEVITIDKDRVMYKIDSFKISIDTVKNLGTFVEVELFTSENYNKALDKISNFSKKLNLTEKNKLKKSVANLAIQKLARY